MVTTMDDVPDKNASGLWELKSCHPRWMEASGTTFSSILLKTCTVDIFFPLARTAAGN